MKPLPSTSENWLSSGVLLFKDFREKKSEPQSACNLCGEKYEARSKFQRFCTACKEHSELYHFSEWLTSA